MSRNTLATVICMTLSLSVAPNAWAQDPEAAGTEDGSAAGTEGSASGSLSLGGSTDSGASASASSDSSGSGSGSGSSPSSTSTSTTDAVAASTVTGPTDHAGVVGKWGIGYMGYRTMAFGADPATGAVGTADAPVIGVRYWMDPSMGIDVGLGLAFATGSVTAEQGGMSMDTDQPEPFVVILHGGIPLAMASSRHFTFEITPELNIGYAANTLDQGGEDLVQRGFHVDLGARAGAEIQFGFLDMPELALQAGVGVGVAIDNTSAELDDASVSVSRTSFTTSSGENPWQIFSANLAALYYFGG